jgi:ankyrin repeat protein
VLYDIAKIFDDDKCLDMLQLLVKLKVNLAKPNNWELIFQLALEGKNKCVVEMIERNGFPCTTLNDKGDNLLFPAALTNSVELIDYLIRSEVSVKHRNYSDRLAVDVAIKYGNTAAINRLFAGSCDVNYQNEV